MEFKLFLVVISFLKCSAQCVVDGKACNTDSDCSDYDYECCNSTCVFLPKLRRGEICNENAADCVRKCPYDIPCISGKCQANTIDHGCPCTSDTDCQKSAGSYGKTVCRDQKCYQLRGKNQPCNADNQCINQVCQNGKCGLVNGKNCDDTLNFCQDYCIDGTCYDTGDVGQPCYNDYQCKRGQLYCKKEFVGVGTCVLRKGLGSPCINDYSCFSDLFCNGTEGKRVCVARFRVGETVIYNNSWIESYPGYETSTLCLTMHGSFPTENSVTCEKQCCQDDQYCLQYDPRDPSAYNLCDEIYQCSEPTADQLRQLDLNPYQFPPKSETLVQMLSVRYPLCEELMEDYVTIFQRIVPAIRLSSDLPANYKPYILETLCCMICNYPAETNAGNINIDCTAKTMIDMLNCQFDGQIPTIDPKCPANWVIDDSLPRLNGVGGLMFGGHKFLIVLVSLYFLNH